MTVDLTTSYLGLRLGSPIVASASPLTGDLDSLRALDDAGIGGRCSSLFEEQIEHEAIDIHELLEHATHSFGEAVTWFPELDEYNTGPGRVPRPPRAGEARGLGTRGREPERHLRRRLAALRAALRGRRCGCARAERLRGRGRPRALERPTSRSGRSRSFAQVREAVSIPLAVKVGPFYSAFAHMAGEAGGRRRGRPRPLQPLPPARHRPRDARGRALARRSRRRSSSGCRCAGSRSSAAPSRSTSPGRPACTTGRGALKLLLAGADATMVASAPLTRGPEVVCDILDGLRAWMVEREYASVEQLRGSLSQVSCPDPAAFERGNYMRALVSYAPNPEAGDRWTHRPVRIRGVVTSHAADVAAPATRLGAPCPPVRDLDGLLRRVPDRARRGRPRRRERVPQRRVGAAAPRARSARSSSRPSSASSTRRR